MIIYVDVGEDTVGQIDLPALPPEGAQLRLRTTFGTKGIPVGSTVEGIVERGCRTVIDLTDENEPFFLIGLSHWKIT